MPFFVSGSGDYRTPSPPRTVPRASDTPRPSFRPSSRSPRSSTDRLPDAFSSRKSFAKTSTSGAPTRFNSSSNAGSCVKGRTPPQAAFVPVSSPTASTRRSMWTTRPHGSSSTTRRVEPSEPKPPSTTPVTSKSANACTTFPHSGRSASKPTDVCSTSNESATIAGSGKTAFTLFSVRVSSTCSAPQRFGSKTRGYRRSCTRSSRTRACSTSRSNLRLCERVTPTTAPSRMSE